MNEKIKYNNLVAVVIVNYNTSEQVSEAIASLHSEAVKEIVVVDNASPSDNPNLIKEKYPHVHLIKLEENVGFGGGCNIGFRWALDNTDAQFVFFLNPDAVVRKGAIQHLILPLLDSHDVAITTPRILMADKSNSLWYGGGYMSWFKGSARVPGYGGDANLDLALKERDVGFASGCAFLIKRAVLEQCGGFLDYYFMYEEDVELSLRVQSFGYKIRYVPESCVVHVGQGSQGDHVQAKDMFGGDNPKLPFFVYYAARNRFYTVFIHGNFLQKIIFLIGFVFWFGRASLNWISFKRWDAFKSLWHGLRDFLITKPVV